MALDSQTPCPVCCLGNPLQGFGPARVTCISRKADCCVKGREMSRTASCPVCGNSYKVPPQEHFRLHRDDANAQPCDDSNQRTTRQGECREFFEKLINTLPVRPAENST